MPYKVDTEDGLKKARETRLRHYRKNREKYIKKSQLARQEKVKYAQELKAKTPCTDCNIQYPHYVMEFDHCRGNKLGGVTFMVGSWKQFFEELSKCDIVCANCHAIRTYRRMSQSDLTVSKTVESGSIT